MFVTSPQFLFSIEEWIQRKSFFRVFFFSLVYICLQYFIYNSIHLVTSSCPVLFVPTTPLYIKKTYQFDITYWNMLHCVFKVMYYKTYNFHFYLLPTNYMKRVKDCRVVCTHSHTTEWMKSKRNDERWMQYYSIIYNSNVLQKFPIKFGEILCLVARLTSINATPFT